MNRLTNCPQVKAAHLRLSSLLDARDAWLCTQRRGHVLCELRRGAWELRVSGASLHLCLAGEACVGTWRVVGWEVRGAKLLLEVTRRAGVERTRLELVPASSVAATKALVAAARQAACERVARSACAQLAAGASIESARLSAGARRGEPGRYARILLKHAHLRVAVAAPVVESGAEAADAFLTSALIWFARLRESVRHGAQAQRLWLVAPPRLAAATCERLPLLRTELKDAISVYEEDERGCLMLQRTPTLAELLSAAPRSSRVSEAEPGALAARIASLAPEAIDVVRARHGETLRFRGLAFARVRRVLGRECGWLGIEGASRRRLVGEDDWPELVRLVEELSAHRRADAPDRNHSMYRAQPEAWLESLLRRDITRLDAGLVVSPVHAQFRVARDGRASGARPVDLLALRRDGRLVLIELKVSEDAALPLQGADYWRRVETERLRGRIAAARLFGDARIAPEPPLVYLVAPLLRFHRSFETLARALSHAIELYRFDINEDWRAGVRVARRCAI
jgi:hypothetical protein